MSAPVYNVTITELLAIFGNGLNEADTPIGGAPVQLSSSPALRVPTTLNAGDTTIIPPQPPLATSKVCIILASDATVLKFKNLGTDSGYQLGYVAGLGYIIGVGTAVGPGGWIGSFILNAQAQTVVTLMWL